MFRWIDPGLHYPAFYTFFAARAPPPDGPRAAMAADAAASATAKAAKASGREKLCAIAPVASGAGSRVSVLNSDAEDRPTAGRAAVLTRRKGEAAGHDGAGAEADQGEAGHAGGKAGLGGDEREPGGGEREGSDDDALVGELQPDDIRVEAERRLAGGKERRAEAGDRRESGRLARAGAASTTARPPFRRRSKRR